MNSNLTAPINLGSSDVYRLVDIVEKIIELTGSTSQIKFESSQVFLRELATPDISKAKETLGWFPIVTLETGLQKTIDFTRAHKDLLTFSTNI
jgi:nucleoside-diphosphate-sugar epimerase